MVEEIDSTLPYATAEKAIRELVEPLLRRFQEEYNVGNGRVSGWNDLCTGDYSIVLTWDYRNVSRCIRIYQIADQLRLTGYAWADGPDDRLWRKQDLGTVKHVGVPGLPWEDYLYEFVRSAYGTLNMWEVSTFRERAPYVNDFTFEELVIGSKLSPGFPIGLPSDRHRKLSSTFFLTAEALATVLAIIASIPADATVRWALIVLFGTAQAYLLNRYAQTRRPKSMRRR